MRKEPIELTPQKIGALRKAYNKAVADKQTDFMFDDVLMNTEYVKFLLEYLESPMRYE